MFCNLLADGGSFQTGMTVRIIIGLVLGGVAGFGFYKLVGCPTGACPLSRNPWVSTIYGMVLGALVAGSQR